MSTSLKQQNLKSASVPISNNGKEKLIVKSQNENGATTSLFQNKIKNEGLKLYVDSLNSDASLQANESILSHDGRYELIMQGDGNLVLYRCSDRHPLWSTGTNGSGAIQAVMQRDGNLVLYTRGSIPSQFVRAESIATVTSQSIAVAQHSLNHENIQRFQPQAFRQEKIQQQAPPQGTIQQDLSQKYELLAVKVWASNTAHYPFSFLRIQNDGNLVIYKGTTPVWDVLGQKLIIAKNNILKKYEQIGGKLSIGLPLTDVQPDGENFIQYFRSGQITTNGISPESSKAVQTNKVQIYWTGLECRHRQESEDEMYGTVTAFTPASGANMIHHFPEGQEYWTMGSDGQRIVQSNALICDSVAGDVYIIASLMEHDSGNIDEYKKKVAELIANAAKAFAAMEGVPAETTASDEGLIGDISLGLVNVISGVLGADDDQYNSGSIKIGKEDILNKFKADNSFPDQFPKFTLNRNDDPRSLEYTHVMYLSGTDQGGDYGEYGLYFEVRLISTWVTY